MLKRRFIKQAIDRPTWTVLLSCIFLVLTTLGASNLYFRGDYKIFFKPDNPQRLAFEEMQNDFSKNENVGIIIAPHNGDVFSPASLAIIKSITDAAWQTPLSTRVDSITNFQHTYVDDDDLLVEDLLLDINQLSPDKAAQIKQIALNEPELRNKIVSADGRVTMVNITVRLPDGDQTKEVEAIATAVRDNIATIKAQYPEVDFYLSGFVIMNDAAQQLAFNDATTLFPLMFAVIALLVFILLGSAYAAIATLIIVFGSIASTMGIAGWMGIFLSMATVNAPILVLTLAVADCVHIIAGVRLHMQNGDNKRDAVIRSVALNTKPVVITSLTTAIGFLSLNFAEVPILSDLGNIAALGVLIACLMSLTLLPAILLLCPIHYEAQQKSQSPTNALMQALHKITLAHYKHLVFAGLAIALAGAYLSTTNQLNDVAINYFDEDSQFRQDADFQAEHLTGLSNIDFAIFTDQVSGINSPTVLAAIDDFAEWLAQQAEVDHVSTITNTYKRLHQNMNGGQSDYYRLPETREQAAQYMLLYEMSLPYGLDVNNQLDINKSATRVVATLKNLGSNEFTGFEQRAKQWFEQRAPNLRITAASPPLMFAHIGEANMAAMIEGSLLALVLISLLLIIALKSVKLGLISLLPNLLPATIGFGIWALLSGEVNMALSVVLSVTLGIVVDDTVHFLSKFQHARAQNLSIAQSIEYTYNSVGTALIITTLVLASGFAVLLLSEFTLNSDMGLLTAIIIALALIIDLLLLPALLFWIYSRTQPNT